MTLDLEKIRQRLANIEDQTSGRKVLWKPEPGEQTVRIVPYIHRPDDPFIELYFHYNVGKKNMLSLKTFGEADPIAEFSDKLKESGSSDDWKLGRKIEPKLRTFVPVLVRGQEKEGVKFWGFGKEIYMSLMQTITDPDWGDITNPLTGRDITVEFKTAKELNKSYPETSIRIKPNQTKATTEKEVALLLKQQPDIFDVFKKPTYEELQAELDAWMNPDQEESTAKASPAPGKAAPPPPPPPSKSEARDIEAEFDQLLGG